MSSVLCSQSVILGAAMAVSGAVILLSLGRQRIFPATQIPTPQNQFLRPCLSTGMQYDYLGDLADLDQGLILEDQECEEVLPHASVMGAAGALQDRAEGLGDTAGDAVGTPAPAGKSLAAAAGHSSDPLLVKLKKKSSRSKKAERRSRESCSSEGTVAYHLEAAMKGCRDALSSWGKASSAISDAGALRDQVSWVSSELDRMKTERDVARAELEKVQVEKDALRMEMARSVEQAREGGRRDGRQEGVDEYVAGYRMKARYAHHAAGDFYFCLKVGARQVLNHYKLKPIRLDARDNAGVVYQPRPPYKAPVVGEAKEDYEGVLEAWAVTEFKDGDPFARKPPLSTVASAGVKRSRDGSPRGEASSALVSKP